MPVMFMFCYFQTKAQDTLSGNAKFTMHFQATSIVQYKPAFNAQYTGDNSLTNEEETKMSYTSTIYLGMRLWKNASLFYNPELAGGSGLSKALGVASATNGETFRVGSVEPALYVARIYYRQLFALGNKYHFESSSQNKLEGWTPDNYLSFTIGKISISDFFDQNTFTHDPREHFMSWGLMNNGAWDYPANTRGYTPSIVIEWVTPKHELRYGASLVPVTANGNEMEWDFTKAQSQTIEYTRNYKCNGRAGSVRLLGFITHANMGNYNQSLLRGINQTPAIDSTRKSGRVKYGFGINAEQWITKNIGAFARAGWNDGANETWAFTEIDHGMSAGLYAIGNKWKRADDECGIAYVVSGISSPHRNYLKAGGKGFMLGDGNLNYQLEHLGEVYYSAAFFAKRMFLSGAYQWVLNPGYNTDRKGPISVFSLRFHVRI
jgi:high affinity Mn2+ porin